MGRPRQRRGESDASGADASGAGAGRARDVGTGSEKDEDRSAARQSEPGNDTSASDVYTDDEAKIEKRLRDLGYL
jgi:hypothetical protein